MGEYGQERGRKYVVWLCSGCDECDPPDAGERVTGPCDGPSKDGAEVVLAEDYRFLEAELEQTKRERDRERRVAADLRRARGRAEWA